MVMMVMTEFGRVCSKSTELHFPDVEDQLESVRNIVPEVIQWRRDHPPTQYDTDDSAQVWPPIGSYWLCLEPHN